MIGGLVVAALLVFLKYREKNSQKLPKPEQRVIRIWPHDRVGDVVIFALVFGILGAKLFDNLENWDRFIQNPIGNLLSPSGLTFYGGLICAGVAICIYARKKGINLLHLTDAIAPAMMIAYAVGRIGCQVAGDGDWGIYNSAYISDTPGHVVLAEDQQFQQKLHEHSTYLLSGIVRNDIGSAENVTDRHAASLENVPRASFTARSFIPRWMVAYTYPHNVNEDGVEIPECSGRYCRALPLPVFPTPFYETVVCTIFFLVLWGVRRKIKIPGIMFSLYLILNGVERFLVETIRVNSTYSIFGLHPTQAEIISLLLVVTGVTGVIYFSRRANAAFNIFPK